MAVPDLALAFKRISKSRFLSLGGSELEPGKMAHGERPDGEEEALGEGGRGAASHSRAPADLSLPALHCQDSDAKVKRSWTLRSSPATESQLM